MKFVKIGFYIVLISILQTIVFPRFNYFGVVPDLFLVSVIIFAVLRKESDALFFAFAVGFLQDLLLHGPYLQTISKIVAAFASNKIKSEFWGDEYSLAAGMVAFLSVTFMLLEIGYCFIISRNLSLTFLLFFLSARTVFNLLMVPFLFPIMARIVDEK